MKSMKNLAGKSSSSSKISWKFDNKYVSFCYELSSGTGYEAPTTAKPKKFAVNFAVNFSKILDEEELCPALFFSDFMLLNAIQN